MTGNKFEHAAPWCGTRFWTCSKELPLGVPLKKKKRNNSDSDACRKKFVLSPTTMHQVSESTQVARRLDLHD